MTETSLRKTPPKTAWTTKDIAYTAMFSALIAVCSWISVPTEVPFTLQTFAIYCTLECIGGKKGFYAILVYILLAAAGVPVLAGFSSGIGVILGTTGGYIIGFFATAIVYQIAEKFPLYEKLWFRVSALMIGTVLCYLFGTLWFMWVYTRETEAISFGMAFSWCVIPFIGADILKMILAFLLTNRVKKYVRF